MPKLLLVEDDLTVSNAVVEWLSAERYVVDAVADGSEGAYLLQTDIYDLIILDWELPDARGIDLLQHYRVNGGKKPVLMLTGKCDVDDKAKGLDTGADDYLTKPFRLEELSARIRALLRRRFDSDAEVLELGALRLEPSAHKVTIDGNEIHLLPKEFAMLELMMRYPGKVFTSDKLKHRVWGVDDQISTQAVFTCILRLRQKLEESGALIITVPGGGYKLASQ